MSCARFNSRVKVPNDLTPKLEVAKDALLSAFYGSARPLPPGWMWELEVKLEGDNLLLIGGPVRRQRAARA